jgi:hypothetical protein
MAVKFITDVLSSDSWKGKRCFILAGGPSLLDFDFSVLKDELTIGINKTFTQFSSTINFSMDKRFYNYVTGITKHPKLEGLPQLWNKYAGLKVFVLPSNNKKVYKNVYLVKRKISSGISFNLNEGIISKSNSGFGAIMLAIALGANPIYLLGYDMKTTEDKTHWHEGYPNRSTIESFTKNLEKYRKIIEEYAPKIEAAGIQVVNLSPSSALKCFPQDTISNILKH